VVAVAGELDLASSDQLRAALLRSEAQARIVILDLRRVSFIDSSALSVIVAQHQRSEADGFRFAIAIGGAPAVERLFDLSGLQDTLTLIDEPEAI
jgi:anti-anti-sigma factor